MSLNDYFREARARGQALGHFNFATADVLKAIVQAGKEAGAPAIMVGTSEGEAEFLGMKEAAALVKALREDIRIPIFLNADHFKSVEKCKAAIDAGYDSVIIDPAQSLKALTGASTSEIYKQCVDMTKAVVQYARAKSPEISVEGELGYLRGSSEVQQKVEISAADYTQPDQAKDFVTRTGVDRLAIVFGNIHGIVKEVIHKSATPTPDWVGVPTETSGEEHLDIEHLKKIVAVVPETYVVLHGASGLADTEVAEAIKAGISNVHFNTELRVAYKEGIEKAMDEKPQETTPYKYLGPADEAVKQLVIQKLKVFMQ